MGRWYKGKWILYKIRSWWSPYFTFERLIHGGGCNKIILYHIGWSVISIHYACFEGFKNRINELNKDIESMKMKMRIHAGDILSAENEADGLRIELQELEDKISWKKIIDGLPEEGSNIFFSVKKKIIVGKFEISQSGLGKSVFQSPGYWEKYPYDNIECWMYVPERIKYER